MSTKIDLDGAHFAQIDRAIFLRTDLTLLQLRIIGVMSSDMPTFQHTPDRLASRLHSRTDKVRIALKSLQAKGMASYRTGTGRRHDSNWTFHWPPLAVDSDFEVDHPIEGTRLRAPQTGPLDAQTDPENPQAEVEGTRLRGPRRGALGGVPVVDVVSRAVGEDNTGNTGRAGGSAEESLAKEERAGDAGDDTEGVSTGPAPRGSQPDPLDEPGDASLDNPDLPAEWQTLLVKIDDHLAAQLLPVLDCYWTHLLASGKPRYPDQLSAILSELIMLVQDRRVDQVIAGIEWTFGGSGCNAPHKAGAVRQYVTQRSDSHTVHRLAQEPNASEARQRVLQAQSPRPRPTRALPAALAPSATEAAEKRERLLAMRQRAGGTAQPVSAPDASDAQPVAETTPYVETRSPELMARLQATLYRASA